MMNLMSLKHTSRARIAVAVMLTAGTLTVTAIALVADPTRLVKDQIKNKLTTELEKSITQEITPGSSPEDFMRIRSASSMSESIKVP